MAFLTGVYSDYSSTDITQTYYPVVGTTTFTVNAGYDPSFVSVYRNGIKLVGGLDYTAIDGVNVVLTVPTIANDIIQIISTKNSAPMGAIPDNSISGAKLNYNIVMPGTGSIGLPVGTTAQRVGSTGAIRYNIDYSRPEIYSGTAWIGLGGATGAGGDDVFYENSSVINNSYTITSGKNAMSTGPITIANGVEVTVPSGSTWVVL